ncbi:MAG: acyloxyacyl hydrolase [Bacteroidales bacterium]|nr:acyloxyacyl hydrolase [Bacteroidales bacterium]
MNKPSLHKPHYRHGILLMTSVTVLILLSLSAQGQFGRATNRSKHSQHRLFKSNLVVGGNVYFGFIANHHLGMEIYNSHFPSMEISLIKATYGKKFWEQLYGYPWIGVTYWFSNLGTSPYLGTVHALFPHINFELYSTKRVNYGLRIGAGLGYLTKTFDRIDNYKHLAIGTHLNFAGNIMFDVRYKANPRLYLTGGISLTHFSNGSFKLPNYGLNIPAIHAGAAYQLNKPNRHIERRLYDPTKPFEFDMHHVFEIEVIGILGYKNLDALFGQKFLVYSLYGNIRKQISYKSRLGVGWDVSYDDSDYKMLEKKQIIVDNKFSLIKTGVSASYGLAIGRLSFDFNYGFYLYFNDIDKADGAFYHKVGVKYDITDKVFANILLKTHWGKADYIGWGIGYRVKLVY